MVDLDHVPAEREHRLRLRGDLFARVLAERDLLVHVAVEPPRHRVVRRVRSREADLHEQRLLERVRAQPPLREVADEVVAVHVLVQIPRERTESLPVVVALPVELALLLDDPAGAERLVPLVEEVAALQIAVLVLHDVALVEAHGRAERDGVHLADVHAPVPRLREVAHPARRPRVAVLVDAGRVRVVALKEARARRAAGRRGDVAPVERDPFADEPIDVRRFRVVESERADRVVALLIGDDEDDVRLGPRVAARPSVRLPRVGQPLVPARLLDDPRVALREQ